MHLHAGWLLKKNVLLVAPCMVRRLVRAIRHFNDGVDHNAGADGPKYY